MLRVHDVHRSFGDQVVLAGIELAVDAGATCALVGGNGAGKSTLLDVVVGALSPQRGRVTIDDVPIGEPRARRRLGYSPAHAIPPEQLATFEWLDLLASLRSVAPRDVDQAVARWGLAAMTDARIAALSLGQRRRLSLAGATMGAPMLLVLDEPTVGLDVDGVTLLVAELRAHRERGGAALVASHDEAFLVACGAERRTLTKGRIS